MSTIPEVKQAQREFRTRANEAIEPLRRDGEIGFISQESIDSLNAVVRAAKDLDWAVDGLIAKLDPAGLVE